jgi:hypothetical protein
MAFRLKREAIVVLDADTNKGLKTRDVVGLIGKSGSDRLMYIASSSEDAFLTVFRNISNMNVVSEKSIPILSFLNSEKIFISGDLMPAIEKAYLK